MKTSYSQSDCYKTCSQHWFWRYKEKLEGEDVGASTFFGTAIDAAVMHLLEGKTSPNFKEVFLRMWTSQKDRKDNEVMIWDNENIMFSHADFDKDVIDDTDMASLSQYIQELSLFYLGNEPISVYKAVSKIKRNPFKRIKENELLYFNRASWISMRQKGLILLDSFVEQFYPKIEKVLTTQKFALYKDEASGDIIQGVVDTVLKLHGHDKPIIFDLKTASKEYTKEQIDHSDQLTLYAAMEGRKYETDKVGYIVLSKNINKDKESFCKTCGHKKQGKHRKCNKATAEGRCNGEWEDKVKLAPRVQVLIETKTPDQVQKVLDDQKNIIEAMKKNIYFKNTSKCNSWYGNRCVYYKLCHENDYSGLKRK